MKDHFNKFFPLFVYGVGILILAGLIRKVGLAHWGELLQGADKAYVLGAVLIYAMTWPLRTWRLKRFTGHMGTDLTVSRVFEIHIAGFALNAVLPAKIGDVAMVGFLKKEGMKTGKAAAAVFQTRVLDAQALVLMLLFVWFLLIKKDAPLWALPSLCFFLLFAFLPFFIVWMDRDRMIAVHVTRMAGKIKHRFMGLVFVKMGEAYEAYHLIASDRSLVFFSLSASFLIWALEGAACCMLTRALGAVVPVEVVIMAVVLGNAGKGFQVTPGGIGVYEGIFAAVLCAFGAPFDKAVTIGILDHLLKKGFNLMLGVYALMRLRHSRT